MTYELVIP
jgi:Ni,Fe-hydrogenase maturation factor